MAKGDPVYLLPIHGGGFVMVDDIDFDRCMEFKWYRHSGGYVVAYVPRTRRAEFGIEKGQLLLLHRFITSAPPRMVVDHISGDKADCRRANLRVVTQRVNMQNTKGRGNRTSRFRGITQVKARGAWQVELHQRRIGTFATEEEAARKWDEAARMAGVPEHRMNFPRMN